MTTTTAQSASSVLPYPNPQNKLTVPRGYVPSLRPNSDAAVAADDDEDDGVDTHSNASTAGTVDTAVSPLTPAIACDTTTTTAEHTPSSATVTVSPCGGDAPDEEVRKKLRRRRAIFSAASGVRYWFLLGGGGEERRGRRRKDCDPASRRGEGGGGIVFRPVEWGEPRRATGKGSGREEDGEAMDPLMRVPVPDGGDGDGDGETRLPTTVERFPGMSGNELYATLAGVDLYPSSAEPTAVYHEYAPKEEEGEEVGCGRVDSETGLVSRRVTSATTVSSYAETENLFEAFGKDRYELGPDGTLRRKLSRVASLRVTLASKIGQGWQRRRRTFPEPARLIGTIITTRLTRKAASENLRQ